MNGIVMLLTLLAAAVLQHTVPGAPLFAQAKLPLVLGVVLYYALNRTPALMLAAATVGGLLGDSLEAMPVGVSAAVLILLGLAAWSGRDHVFRARLLTHAVFGLLGGAGLALGVGGLLMVGHESLRGQAWPGLLLKAAGTGLGGLVTAPLVFAVLDRFDRWTGNVAGGTSP